MNWSGSMKKSIIPILAVLMLPVSCARVELPADTEEQYNERIEGALVISARTEADTKAVLNDGTKVAFQSTDSLSVFSGSDEWFYNDMFTALGVHSDGTADFQGTLSEETEEGLVVMYPYQSNASHEKYGKTRKLYFTLPAEQTATTGSFDPAAFICTGVTESTDEGFSVTLGTVCALVKFTMPEGSFSKVTLTANGGEALAGSGSVGKTDDYKDFNISDENGTVTLSGQIAGGQTYYMAVAPTTASKGITVQIFDEDGNLAGEKSTTNEVTFTRNRILNLGTLTGQNENKWLGKGTKDSPYIISCANHLRMLSDAYSTIEGAEKYAGKYFKQTEDIDMGGEPFTIGNYELAGDNTDFTIKVGAAFNGIYDGGGHMVKGYKLKVLRNDPSYAKRHSAGLFCVVNNATIQNLTVFPDAGTNNQTLGQDDFKVSDETYYIGLLAGLVAGKSSIINCRSAKWTYKFTLMESSFFNITNVMIGGLVGGTTGKARDIEELHITGCTNEATLMVSKGVDYVNAGGILGSNDPSSEVCYIDRCRNKGKISMESVEAQVCAGGIAGRIQHNGSYNAATYNFSNCVNEADIEAITTASQYACAGGIAGSNYCDGNLTDPWFHNCLNKGDIYASGGDDLIFDTTDAEAGGICGYCYDEDTKFALCINIGRISAGGDPYTAPIVVTEGDQYWCYWLDQPEFENYEPDGSLYRGFICPFIIGNGSGVDNPEYVRIHGKTGLDTSSKTLYTETDWSEADWKAAAAWTGTANDLWGTADYENTLDLVF